MRPKKRYGQNFLIDENIINKINSLITVSEYDLILEIGPGTGALTKELIKKDSFYLGIEIDTDLEKYLKSFESEKISFLYENILDIDLEKYLKNFTNVFVVGNLPYYITTKIITHLVKDIKYFKKIVVMVQKEVGERFLAKPKSKDYGYFTVFLNNYFNIKKETSVTRNSFYPKPKVESTVLTLEVKNDYLDDDEFFTFLKRVFLHKRKSLKNNLTLDEFNEIKMYIEKKFKNTLVRAEEISLEEFIEIYNLLKK